MASRYTHLIISSLLIILSLAVFFTAGGFQDPGGAEPGPAFFPRVLSILLFILAIFLLFQKDTNEEEENKVPLWRIGIPMLLFAFYIISINILGFAVSTGLFVIFLLWFLGSRRWWVQIVTAISISAAVTYSFEVLLNVPLPHGFLY